MFVDGAPSTSPRGVGRRQLGQHLALPGTRHTAVLQALLRSYAIEVAKFGDLDEGRGPAPGLI